MSNKKSTQLSIRTYGIGRRKTSIATVYLIKKQDTEAQHLFEVNQSLADKYFQYNFHYLKQIQNPLQKFGLNQQYQIIAKVQGGGLTGQADAIKLALARAICNLDRDKFRPILKADGRLTRDSRIKERRKYGLKKARKASQYSKR